MNAPPMDLTVADVVKRVLAEHRVDPERALVELLRALVEPHLASRLGPPAPASRELSLVSLLDPNAADASPQSR